MNCQKCGAQLPEGAMFCPVCGAAQAPAAAPPYQQSAQQPAYQPVQPPAYQQPTQQPFRTDAPSQGAAKIPWHSRGKLSPLNPGAKRVSILFAAALTIFQAVLFVIFTGIGETTETDMLTAQLVGFIPTAVLIVYLFCLDTIEKEPVSLLLKLFLIEGVLTMFVVAYVELAFEAVFSSFLDEDTLIYHIVDNLIGVALVEESFKFVVLKKFTWKHPAFNYRFDGIVYAAVTALGFAAFENMAYIGSYGFSVALSRMVSAVPGHCVDGILMGIFYGKAKLLEGRGDRSGSRRCLLLCLLAPIAEHGFYDFFANTGDGALSVILFYAYVFILNATVFVLVWRLAQKDEAIYQAQPQYTAWQ